MNIVLNIITIIIFPTDTGFLITPFRITSITYITATNIITICVNLNVIPAIRMLNTISKEDVIILNHINILIICRPVIFFNIFLHLFVYNMTLFYYGSIYNSSFTSTQKSNPSSLERLTDFDITSPLGLLSFIIILSPYGAPKII